MRAGNSSQATLEGVLTMKTLYRAACLAVLAVTLGSATSTAALPAVQVAQRTTYYTDATRTVSTGYTLYMCDGEIYTSGYETPYYKDKFFMCN
jgi:hypothetical protein